MGKHPTTPLTQVEAKPLLEGIDHDSSAYTTGTPAETIRSASATDNPPSFDVAVSSSVPWPGSTFILRSATTGLVLTLLDGQINLAPVGGTGSIHWVCVETKGWLGFRNPVSGRFLGHDGGKGRLVCAGDRHREHENFCVRLRPEGGFVLLATKSGGLAVVGSKIDKGVEMLARVESGNGEEIVWEFVKV